MVDTYPIFVALDATALEGGRIYIGAANADPEQSPISVYWDAALTVLATQPLRTSGGVIVRDGTPADVYGGSPLYSIRVRNRSGSVVWYKPIAGGNLPSTRLSFPIPTGPASTVPGPSNNTRIDLTALKVAAISDLTSLYSGSLWTWTTGDFTGKADDALVVASSNTPLTVGAWVRSVEAVTPEFFNAKGDGVTDDTAALQRAFSNGGTIRLTPGKTYLVKSKLIANKAGMTITGGGKIKVASDFSFTADTDSGGTHMRAIFVQESNITFNGIVFDATGAPVGTAVENGFIWSTHPSTTVSNCQFTGLTKGTCVWGLAGAPFMAFNGNQVVNCSGAVFTKGRNCLHNDNIIINATDAAIAINGQSSIGSVVQGNTLHNQAMAVIPSMIAVEESATDWVISGNSLRGVNGGGIIATNVLDSTVAKGGVISDNVIDGRSLTGALGTSANPAALISVSTFYTDCTIHDNIVTGVPLGNANSRAIIVPATGTLFHHNTVDTTANSSISALVNITAGTRGITIEGNVTRAASTARHFLGTDGDFGNSPVSFKGGKFYGGAEAINFELRVANITNLRLHIHNLDDVTATSVINASTALGDRAAFLNAGAWAYPHNINVRTEMRCIGVPSNAGMLSYQNGDLFHFLDPVTNGALAVVKVAGGTPWIKYGAAA